MTPVTLPAYGVGGGEVTIIAERVISWSLIDYNGRYGTEVHLDGRVENVGLWPQDFEKALLAAVAKNKEES